MPERQAAPFARTGIEPDRTAAIPVLCAGHVAAEALGAEVRWEVLAVFRRSVYCRGAGGALLCLGPLSLGVGPLNLLCALPDGLCWDAGLLAPGQTGSCDGGRLRLADRWTFRLEGAVVWRPARPPVPVDSAIVAAGLARLAQELSDRPERGGLQPLLPWLARGLFPPSEGWPASTPLLRLALPGIRALARWVEAGVADPGGCGPAPCPAAEILLGLGPGLTPSGDDLVGGLLVALRAFAQPALADRLAAGVLAAAQGRTNAISLAHLAAAAAGSGAGALHDVLCALAAPGTPGLGECLRAIDPIGHTSGWDALAGVTLAAALIARGSPDRRPGPIRRAGPVRADRKEIGPDGPSRSVTGFPGVR